MGMASMTTECERELWVAQRAKQFTGHTGAATFSSSLQILETGWTLSSNKVKNMPPQDEMFEIWWL